MPKVLDAPFYGASISDNLMETQDGFLVCLNVPVARTGKQTYMGSEIGGGKVADKVYTAHRLEEDVFHPDTIASFNGKPVTDDHPTIYPVAPENYQIYAKGHAQNARRVGNNIVVDLVITDPVLISKIKGNVKRQVSVGYNCEWPDYKGGVRQINIRANHIAVVATGRAGPSYAIKDELPKNINRRKIVNKKQALSRMFAAFAKDASPEEIEQVMQYVNDTEPEKPSEAGLFKKFLAAFDSKAKDEDEKKDDEDEKSEAKDKALDERFNKLEAALDALTKALDKKAKDEDEKEDIELAEKLLENEKAEAKDEDETEKMAEDEDAEEEKKAAKDAQALMTFINELKPTIASMPDRQQKAVKDALNKALGKTPSGTFAAIKKAAASHAPSAKDSSPKDPASIGKAIAAKHNPHYKQA